jgi:hypothetical protein
MEKCSFRDSDMELPIIEGVIGSRYGGPGQKYGDYKGIYTISSTFFEVPCKYQGGSR